MAGDKQSDTNPEDQGSPGGAARGPRTSLPASSSHEAHAGAHLSATDSEPPATRKGEGGRPADAKRDRVPSWLGILLWRLFPEGHIERHRFPAVLVSFIVHLTLLLVLALLSPRWGLRSGRPQADLTVVGPADRTAQPSELQMMAESPAAPDLPDSALEMRSTTTVSDRSEDAAEVIRQLLDQNGEQPAQPQSLHASLFDAVDLRVATRFRSTGIEGRAVQRRRDVALARGGTVASEAAVERALAWLAEHQMPNGSWSLVHDRGPCQGRCGNPGSPQRFEPAATGLSLLAFLGAGYTHREGKYRDTVRKGIYYLLQVMEETPLGGSFLYQCDRGMYNHGIAAFALCEAYQMTHDPDLQKAAQAAINYSIAAQHYHGSWGYLPQQPGDLTISGWHIMALKSAQAAELAIADTTIMRLGHFLDSQQDDDPVFYGYRERGKNRVCTSIGNLVRLFLGRSPSDPLALQAADYIQRQGPSYDDIYFNYYATLLLFHMGGGHWEQWNPRMRDFLISTQATRGHEAGSWYFDNHFGSQGGRLYTTAMATMTLEIYYRYSPLYQQTDEDFRL